MPPLGFEYLTSNQYTAYPFKEDAIGLARADIAPVHGALATLPLNFLIDAVIYLPQDVHKLYPTAYLFSIIKVNATDWELTITGPGGVAETLFTVTCQLGGSDVIGVQTSTGTTARLLKGSGFDTYLAVATADYFTDTLPFEDCVVTPRPLKLDSLYVCDSTGAIKPGQPVLGLRDRVQLKCGYNIVTVVSTDPMSDLNSVLLRAVPGAGEGVAPVAVQPVSPARNVAPMGLIPDRFGGVRIVTDECYEVVPIGNTLQIDGNCYACCTCADYVAVAKAVKALIARADVLKKALLDPTGLHDQYVVAVDNYNNVYYPAHRKLYAFVKAVIGVAPQAGHSFAGSQQLSVSVRVMNRSDAVATDFVVKLTTIPATTVLSATFTKGSDIVGGNLTTQLAIGDLCTNKGTAITWLVTTGSPNNPVTNVRVTLDYVLDGVTYTDSVVFDGPPESAT